MGIFPLGSGLELFRMLRVESKRTPKYTKKVHMFGVIILWHAKELDREGILRTHSIGDKCGFLNMVVPL